MDVTNFEANILQVQTSLCLCIRVRDLQVFKKSDN